jgi:hypothetical protein
MREELDKQLCEKYPVLFAQRNGSPQETAMCWGFDCGDGWHDLINILCANIQNHIVYGRGGDAPQVVVMQVKEKFGGLRFYYHGGDEHISGMVRMAESWASVTCETCGDRGTIRHGGWIRTLCDKHEAEYQARQAKYMSEDDDV